MKNKPTYINTDGNSAVANIAYGFSEVVDSYKDYYSKGNSAYLSIFFLTLGAFTSSPL